MATLFATMSRRRFADLQQRRRYCRGAGELRRRTKRGSSFCGLPFVVARQLADQVADRGYSDRTAKPAAEKRIGMGEASGDAITWRGLSIVPHGQMIRIARDTADGSASALIPASQLERWCLRMLRQEALA